MVYTIILSIILGIFTSAYTLEIHSIKSLMNKNGSKSKWLYIVTIMTTIISLTIFLYNRYGLTNQFITMSLCAWLMISISIYDIRRHEVPMDALLLGGSIGIIMVIINPNIQWIDALLGCIGVGGSLVLISRLTKGALGMGDALVIGVIGLNLGYKMALAILLYGTVFSGLVGLVMLVFGLVNRKTKMPMVPFLMGAYMLLIFI